MIFYKSETYHAPFDAEYPCVVLTVDTWDDWYRYETLFSLNYHESKNKHEHIGRVKIYKIDTLITRNVMDETFNQLDEDYCSLGQDLEYYEKLAKLGLISKEILFALRDSAIHQDIRKKFENLDAFQNSLLRFSEAEKALNQAEEDFFGKNPEKRIFEFNFSCKLESATMDHSIDFNFKEDKRLPFRINVLIGKNGTGKTQVLSKLGNVLSGYKHNHGIFTPSRPLFSKVIAISYSAFDNFEKPHQNEYSEKGSKSVFSYIYCGIQGGNGVYTLEEIKENFLTSYNKVVKQGRKEQWRKILEHIIEKEHIHILDQIEQGNFDIHISSGQNIILSTITDVIANIENESILLFDEPELHLHPNAMSNLIRMFNVLLDEFKSYAIISTHSPIIIQETPSKYVHVFKRIQNTPTVKKLDLESFGENLSNITNEIFGVKNIESNYKVWLEKMVNDENLTFDGIQAIFEDNLSLNALTYLKILFKQKGTHKND
ncbi:ATP-binding protein [Paenibacillus endoradicis]|uniref:ATP-binding protein n=1 Tax=Paenibacillus endoradicis TaxID=2972487 RepID=UPI002158A4D4|nr:ATP-binding protein [Paenibacillus endoradicis]MCR8659175.1 ATP-binding protein [Paenibacillus endoradicis]